MLIPKRVKHRRVHRGRMTGKAIRGSQVDFGEFGLQAMEPGWITNTQIEAARVAMTRSIRRGGKVWIRIFPDKPVTKKPAETRMGSGKGSPELWVAVVSQVGSCLRLQECLKRLREAMRLAACCCRLCKFVSRNGRVVMHVKAKNTQFVFGRVG